MATPSFGSLNPAQKRMALAKWHAKQDGKTSLTPDQAKKAALAQVVAPGLTRGQLNQTVTADTGLRYGSTEKDLRQQPGRINSAFAAYKQAIANASNNLTGSGDQVGGSYGGAVQQVKDLQSGLDQTAKDQWAGQQQAMAADAASRGATADPKLADVAHNASNVRNILTGSYGAMLLGQGANARQGFVDRGVNAEQQRGEQQSGVRANLQKLLAEKGAFKTSDAQTIVSNTTSNALKNALTGAQVGATTAGATKANASAGLTAATTAFLKRFGRLPSSTDPNSATAKLDNARLDYFNKHGYFPPTGPPKKTTPKTGPGSVTPLQKTSRTSDFRKILHNAKQVLPHVAGSTVPGASSIPGVAQVTQLPKAQQVQKIYDAISPDYSSANQDVIMGAIQMAVYGRVGPKVGKALKGLGIDQSYWNG